MSRVSAVYSVYAFGKKRAEVLCVLVYIRSKEEALPDSIFIHVLSLLLLLDVVIRLCTCSRGVLSTHSSRKFGEKKEGSERVVVEPSMESERLILVREQKNSKKKV